MREQECFVEQPDAPFCVLPKAQRQQAYIAQCQHDRLSPRESLEKAYFLPLDDPGRVVRWPKL